MIYCIGDIHGNLYALRKLLEEEICVQKTDHLVFLGDYVGIGPDSSGVLSYILNLKKSGFSMKLLLGDHEVNWNTYLGLMDIAQGKPSERLNDLQLKLFNWLHEECGPTMKSYMQAGRVVSPQGGVHIVKFNIPKSHVDLYYEFKEMADFKVNNRQYLCVHAGLRPGVSLAEQKTRDLVSLRKEFYASKWKIPKTTIIFGHSPFRKGVFRGDGKIGIDTGCGYCGGKLTAIRLEDEQIFQVENDPLVISPPQ